MTIEEITKLKIGDLFEKNSAIGMWITDPFLDRGKEVLDAWGFDYKTVLFYWAKLNKSGKGYFFGNGYYTRANVEQCWLAVKKKGKGLKVLDRSVPRLIVSPVRRHSQKPDEAYPRIQKLFGDVSKIEIFARNTVPGWTSWGNEVDSDPEITKIILGE